MRTAREESAVINANELRRSEKNTRLISYLVGSDISVKYFKYSLLCVASADSLEGICFVFIQRNENFSY